MRKSKKFAAFIAAALVFAIAVPLFAACTPRTDGGEHSQHGYDPASGVWEWNGDLTEAYFVLTCLDADCGHVERMPAAVRDISGDDGPTCTEGGARRARASVILDGRGHIDEESKEMGALGHSIEDKADTGYHWRECSRCGLVENKAEHAFGPFTCDVNGHSRVCAECEYVHSGRHSNDIFDTCTICGFEGGNENGGTGDNPSKPNLAQTSTALPAVIKNIYHTYENVKFDGTAPVGIDAAIGVVVDGVTYGLFAKGNLDLTKSNTEDETEFYIGIDKKDGERENLFSLAYDVPSIDTPYLYIGSSSAGYFKTNGLSFSEMLYDLDNQQHADDAAVTSAEEEGVDLIDTIAELAGGLLGSAIFGTTCQMNQSATGGVQYVFTLDVQYMLSTFGSQITSLLGLVGQFAGDSIDLDAYIGPVVDGIANLLPEEDKTAIVGTEENPVTDASTKLGNLFKVLAKKMGNASDAKANNIIIKMAFDFNPDNTFAGAVIGVDASKYVDHLNNAAASEEDKIDFDGKVQIKIDRLAISNTAVSDPFLEADAGLKDLIADTDAEAHNILDFDFEITAESDDDSDDDSYVIKADFDLDPFVLTEMMKYSDKTMGTDGNYAQSEQGQKFWKEKMAAALAKAGTATIIVTKDGYTESKFDGNIDRVENGSVIAYGKIDSTGIDVFVWDPVKKEEVTFGGGLTFPLKWSELIDKLAKPVQAGTSAEGNATETIQKVFGYVGDIFPLIDDLLAEIKIDEAKGSLTLGYASVIENVVWDILDIFVTEENSGWIDANLNNLLAAIFGSVTEGEGGTIVDAAPADSVTFTLKSFNYCGKAIYPAAE